MLKLTVRTYQLTHAQVKVFTALNGEPNGMAIEVNPGGGIDLDRMIDELTQLRNLLKPLKHAEKADQDVPDGVALEVPQKGDVYYSTEAHAMSVRIIDNNAVIFQNIRKHHHHIDALSLPTFLANYKKSGT